MVMAECQEELDPYLRSKLSILYKNREDPTCTFTCHDDEGALYILSGTAAVSLATYNGSAISFPVVMSSGCPKDGRCKMNCGDNIELNSQPGVMMSEADDDYSCLWTWTFWSALFCIITMGIVKIYTTLRNMCGTLCGLEITKH